jgi:DNA-binding MarR family transcriptional regulator
MADKQPHDLLDETIHQRTRLAIMATLTGVESLDFAELKAQLGLTDGNLSVHLSNLERPGYVKVTKSFVGKRPRTTIEITPRGRKAMENYVNLLQAILKKKV